MSIVIDCLVELEYRKFRTASQGKHRIISEGSSPYSSFRHGDFDTRKTALALARFYQRTYGKEVPGIAYKVFDDGGKEVPLFM